MRLFSFSLSNKAKREREVNTSRKASHEGHLSWIQSFVSKFRAVIFVFVVEDSSCRSLLFSSRKESQIFLSLIPTVKRLICFLWRWNFKSFWPKDLCFKKVKREILNMPHLIKTFMKRNFCYKHVKPDSKNACKCQNVCCIDIQALGFEPRTSRSAVECSIYHWAINPCVRSICNRKNLQCLYKQNGKCYWNKYFPRLQWEAWNILLRILHESLSILNSFEAFSLPLIFKYLGLTDDWPPWRIW